ncbi:DUF2213 domain-containing protein [Parasutterella excrementihominis]|uniref:DUF2213 domain-containing protein n=1 Tax=Parasutterella excrementihominis TaxID=487175 RepID=UPI00242C85FB|nr:DUF2213 domain-containing protein [Parasutterella excrementihominis]
MRRKFRDGRFLTTEKISPLKGKTPEGYLLCRDVPISRVGSFEYSAAEVGLPNIGRAVQVWRPEEQIFNPETIASFEAKPVVIGHARFADPDNWREIAVGTTQNVRRGEGDKSDFLLADLLLTDRKAIEAVESGDLKEVSCGYDADTQETPEGIEQIGIVGNHVALVVSARCSGCKIGDGSMTTSLKTRLRKLFRDGNEDAFNEEVDKLQVQDGDAPDATPAPAPTPAPTPTLEERLAKLEAMVAALAKGQAQKPVGDADTPPVPDDTVAPGDDDELIDDPDAQAIIGDAEALCPGMKKPVGDAKGGKFTRNQIERVMRTALKGAGVKQFGDSSELDGKALDIAFKAAVAMSKSGKNPKASGTRYGDSAEDSVNSIAYVQKKLNDFWGAK